HRSRSVSSKCGSADLLEALGVNITLSPQQCEKVLEEVGICFLMATTFHLSMKYVTKVRKELANAVRQICLKRLALTLRFLHNNARKF
ncbi:MAG: hypothetical protein LE178_06860, partial [Endomicrobium sp.]|nr:hypothetical protein [Endomicrobium sp.]